MTPGKAVDPEEPVESDDARGLALVGVDRTDSTLYWGTFLRDVADVTGVHIHRGGPDENGPHLAELYNTEEPTDEVNGYLDGGSFESGDACADGDFPAPTNCITQPGQPSGPPEEVTFEGMLEEIRSGETYVQTHTSDGVVRGQLR